MLDAFSPRLAISRRLESCLVLTATAMDDETSAQLQDPAGRRRWFFRGVRAAFSIPGLILASVADGPPVALLLTGERVLRVVLE